MNKKLLPMAVLVITILLVHSLYVFWIIPEVQSLEQIASETGSILPRNFFVILKDFEQELCIILFIFAVYLCTEKLLNIASHAYLFDIDFLKNIEDAPSDALENLIGVGEDLNITARRRVFQRPGHNPFSLSPFWACV